MGLSTFAIMTLNFYNNLKSMIDDGLFHSETLKLVQDGVAHIEGKKRVVELKIQKEKSKP